jgi:hypothetical protein
MHPAVLGQVSHGPGQRVEARDHERVAHSDEVEGLFKLLSMSNAADLLAEDAVGTSLP